MRSGLHTEPGMDILYLLIPLSAGLVLIILGVFGWALWRDQFEDLEREAERILDPSDDRIDSDQGREQGSTEQ